MSSSRPTTRMDREPSGSPASAGARVGVPLETARYVRFPGPTRAAGAAVRRVSDLPLPSGVTRRAGKCLARQGANKLTERMLDNDLMSWLMVTTAKLWPKRHPIILFENSNDTMGSLSVFS